MKPVRFALLRHGVTTWNAEKRIQGRSDIPISPETAQWYSQRRLPADWGDVKWFSSPLLRTRETAKALGISPVYLEESLIEMNWGEWEGQRLPELRASLGDVMRENEDRGWDFRPEGGESPRDVLARVTQFIAGSHPEIFGGVTHKGVIRAVYSAARGWNMLGKIPDRLDWHCLHVFRWSENTGFRIEALNVPLIPKQEADQ